VKARNLEEPECTNKKHGFEVCKVLLYNERGVNGDGGGIELMEWGEGRGRLMV